MKNIARLKQKLASANTRYIAVGLGVLTLIALVVVAVRAGRPTPIRNFDECVKAGYPVQESYPAVCRTYDGRSFTQDVKQNQPSEPLTAREFKILVTGVDSGGSSEPKNVVVKSQTDWEALWQKTYSYLTPKPEILKVDFAKDMVIGVFAGTQPTGGYSTKVTSVEESASQIIVNVKETEPGKNCIVTQSMTSPHYFVTTAKSDKPVDFQVEHENRDCSASQVQP